MLRFHPTPLTPAERQLQAEVREFLQSELPRGTFAPGLGMASPRDPAFSRKLGQRGWLGMALPRRYGGGDRTAAERFVVVEELLRWGAPVGYHWVADRQSGPMIARFGSEAQKQRFLPEICRGETSFSIGMSEPEAGSDLAAVQTKAERVDGGWNLSGTKLWTGGAHVNDWFVVLCRTSQEEDKQPDDSCGARSSEAGRRARAKHEGLSQLIVSLHAPGLTAQPIPYLDGSEFFCQVTLNEVFVQDDMVLGEVGSGWAQNTSELSFERAGPERWLSTYLLVEQLLREDRVADDHGRAVLGQALASWWAIRALSLSVARLIDAGQAPVAESALVKELGTRFEQEVLDAVWYLVELEPDPASESEFERLLSAAILAAPSFTIRGGTNEILRSVAARALRA
ncbi:MAG TPA: acyl-CoA dehydrogenase family protein [Solirubrobacteraceae bacterium]|nr:acyl-CoA dehydrogenase family protein [Solirubrobacteraceae bacterium]